MAVKAREPDQLPEPDLYFTKADLQDVVPHDNDPVVVSVVTVARRVHRVLIDQGSLGDIMFWSTFNKLQLSPNQLRPYDDCLYGFAGDHVEVRGHVELRMTFTDEVPSLTTFTEEETGESQGNLGRRGSSKCVGIPHHSLVNHQGDTF